MTMSAPGKASKMPSGSDINADVSSTTILLMMTSHIDRGATGARDGGTHARRSRSCRVVAAADEPSDRGSNGLGLAWVEPSIETGNFD